MHAGNGQVQGNLLVGLERKVGEIEGVAFDQVPVLLVAGEAARAHRYALIAQQTLVPLEGLAACRVLHGVPRNLLRDRFQGEGLCGVEQDEHQVGHPFEAIESCRGSHPGEPTAATAP